MTVHLNNNRIGFKDTKQSIDKITPKDILNDLEVNKNKLEQKEKSKIRLKIPPFPVDAFPKQVQEIINEFYKAYQLPKDYYGLGILTVCASAIGNAFCLKYKEGYNVPPILYSAIVGGSSIGKTPALKLCLNPIFKIEEKYEKEYNQSVNEWELSKKDAEKKESIPSKPERSDLLINDATTEAINRVLEKNPKGLILFQDELIAWINSLNQYRKGSDTEFWLSNWSNSTTKINRATKEPIFLKKPFVNVLGGIQPTVLDGLGEGNKKDNGFLFRILFAFPDEQKKPYDSDYVPSVEIFQFYQNLVFGIHQLPNNIIQNSSGWEIETIPLELSKDAKKLFQRFSKENTDLINSATNDSVKSLYGKLENYCLRFALTLEIMNTVCLNGEIDELSTEVRTVSVRSAIKLTEYFRATGIKVLNRIEKINPLDDYSKVQQKVYEALPITFNTPEGVEIAGKNGMAERTFKRLLKDNFLFDKVSRGVYDKCL